MRTNRYGEEILRTPMGSWYWSSVLEDVNFIPAGKRTASYQTGVHTNTMEHALRQVARITASWEPRPLASWKKAREERDGTVE